MKLYISCPISVDMLHLGEAAQAFSKMGYEVTYWDRNTTYTSVKLKEADIVAFILPKMTFAYKLDEFSLRIKKEYEWATESKKEIVVAYRSVVNKEWNLYEAKVVNKSLSGVSGTYSKYKYPPKKDKPAEYAVWNSYKGKLEYKTLPDIDDIMSKEFKVLVNTEAIPSDIDVIREYLGLSLGPKSYTYQKAQGEKRSFSEMAIIQQKTKVRRLLLL